MVSQPTYLKNLKDHARLRRGMAEDKSKWVADLQNESDRGAVILASTALEDIIEEKILERLPGLVNDDAERKNIFEAHGPLSTFSSKVDLAYAMGLIDKEYQKIIHLIREIRNACAHSRQPISFKDEALREVAKVIILKIFPDLIDHTPTTLRLLFIIICNTIAFGIYDDKKYDTPEELLDLFKSIKASRDDEPFP